MNRTTDDSAPSRVPDVGESAPASGSGLVRRWSRRKAQARREELAVPGDAGESPNAGAQTDAPETTPPALTDADMPPIESLDKDSDFRPFLSPGVSDALRTLALRRLFHSGLFNERCPLDSESYDFRGEEALGSVITHEMREEMERAAAALKEQARQAMFETDKPVVKPAASGPEPVTDPTAASSAPDSGARKEG